MDSYLKETKILDYSNVSIQELLEQRGWKNLDTVSRVKAIYNFVRDEIKFGYNVSDDIPASEILKEGYGQCNTKTTLLMTILRAMGNLTEFTVLPLPKPCKRELLRVFGTNFRLKTSYIVGLRYW